jgi:hypothetical protein
MTFITFVFAISGVRWFRVVRLRHNHRSPTRGLLEGETELPSKAGGIVVGVATLCGWPHGAMSTPQRPELRVQIGALVSRTKGT